MDFKTKEYLKLFITRTNHINKMYMKSVNYLLIMLTACMLWACQSKESVPFTVADHYFVNNNVEQLPMGKIESQAEFERLFGMATVMGENGKPTPIDFSKEYIIAVSIPQTSFSTTIEPVSLQKTADGKIVFSYKVNKGEKMSYSILPSLIVVVDKKYDREVTLSEVTE